MVTILGKNKIVVNICYLLGRLFVVVGKASICILRLIFHPSLFQIIVVLLKVMERNHRYKHGWKINHTFQAFSWFNKPTYIVCTPGKITIRCFSIVFITSSGSKFRKYDELCRMHDGHVNRYSHSIYMKKREPLTFFLVLQSIDNGWHHSFSFVLNILLVPNRARVYMHVVLLLCFPPLFSNNSPF